MGGPVRFLDVAWKIKHQNKNDAASGQWVIY